jgi:hypothetical protein
MGQEETTYQTKKAAKGSRTQNLLSEVTVDDGALLLCSALLLLAGGSLAVRLCKIAL